MFIDCHCIFIDDQEVQALAKEQGHFLKDWNVLFCQAGATAGAASAAWAAGPPCIVATELNSM